MPARHCYPWVLPIVSLMILHREKWVQSLGWSVARVNLMD